jgi:hypothetical protein
MNPGLLSSISSAWAYRMRARIGRHKVDRIEALPKVVRDIGWKAQVRLSTRYRRLSARGKNANVVNVAIAREMVGFIWSIASRFNPRQRRHDPYLTDSQQRRSQHPRSASARYAALEAGQCRGALVHRYEPRCSPSRQRQPQTKQGHAARPADERLLTDVQVPPLAPHIRRTKRLDR